MSAILGLIGISFSIWFALTHHTGGYQGYLDPAGLVLCGVGTPSIMLLSHSVGDFVMGIKLLFSAMVSRLGRQQEEVIDILTNASKAMRADGLPAIVPFRDRASYGLLRDGLSLLINDFKPEEIRHNLLARANAKQTHMQMAVNLFENMAKAAPGVGMIGTLIGLIGMLSNMSDPAKIGANMALAMVTTLYGLMLGTIVFGPWSEKVALEAERCLEVDMLVVEGILNIKGKKSSQHLRDLVSSYGSAAQKPQSAPSKKGA